MSRQVTVIEPTKQFRFGDNGLITTTRKKVCAYCRVSSEKDEQLHSFDNQVDEWTKRLTNDPSIEFVGIYADEGITGTSQEERKQLQRMIEDCKLGKIDKIMTKSISRFARNVADSINISRELKAIGVEIYFDNEHISTLDPSSEVMFTLSAVMAQEESRHISDNVKWTFAKMFKEGIPMISSNLYGYRKDPENKKNLIIIPEEAEVIKEIFTLYTSGIGPSQIARILTQKGYKTKQGRMKWYDSTVEGIIQNEKYCGDLILQKTVTPDFLTHKRVKNDGLAHKYHIKDNHEPIVDRETWDRAQAIRQANAKRFRGINQDTRKYQSRYPYSGIILCADCGNTYKRRMWTQGYPEPRVVYQCNGFIKGEIGHRCQNKNISEDILNKALCEIINTIYKTKEKIFSDIGSIITKQIKIENVEKQLTEYEASKENIEKELDAIITQKSKATTDIEQDILDRKYRNYLNEYQHINDEIIFLKGKQANAEANNIRLQQMKEILNKEEITPDMLTQAIVQTFIQNIIVVDKTHAVIVLATGTSKSNKEISENRKAIINKAPLLEGIVHLDRKFKPEKLNYKVVTY